MSQTFSFDPQLPDLPLAFDLAALARRFAARWPAADGPVSISTIKLQDTKYQPHARCVSTYALTVERPGQPAFATIGVLEITPAGAADRLYSDDPRLPWLAAATDPAAMCGHFATLLPGATIESAQSRRCATGRACAACFATIFTPRPGRRHSSAS